MVLQTTSSKIMVKALASHNWLAQINAARPSVQGEICLFIPYRYSCCNQMNMGCMLPSRSLLRVMLGLRVGDIGLVSVASFFV